MEGEYLAVVACSRWPVLVFLFCFDIFCHIFRIAAKCFQLYLLADQGRQLVLCGLDDTQNWVFSVCHVAISCTVQAPSGMV